MRARNVFWEIAKRRREFTDNDPDTEYRYAMQQMSMALQRENARIFEAHIPRRIGDPDTDDDDDPPVIFSEDVATGLRDAL